jgi:hypothetical protein
MAFPEMNWRITFIVIVWVVASVVLSSNVRAADESQGPIFAINEENDLFLNPLTANHTDRHYTQGLKLIYRDGDDELPQWAVKTSDALPPLWMNTRSQNIGYVFGQNIYTPQDILTGAPVKTDRPYDGWLYGGMFLQRRGDTSEAKIPVMESFEVDVGLTGPTSLAGATQVNFHHWFLASDVPRGWHNQLDTEPGLLLEYERLWRLSLNEQTARYVDLIPHGGKELEKLPGEGCALINWHGQRVSLVCLDRGHDDDLFLFIIDRSALPEPPLSQLAQFVRVNNMTTASWTVGDNTSVLASKASEEDLRKFL